MVDLAVELKSAEEKGRGGELGRGAQLFTEYTKTCRVLVPGSETLGRFGDASGKPLLS
jgi:hypothetical protein